MVKFPLGQVVATPPALATFSPSFIRECLRKHSTGDPGCCHPDDVEENSRAILEGTRVFSVYKDDRGNVLWIITEADRTSTCVLLPSDY